MNMFVSDVHRRSIIVDGHCDTPYRMFRHNVHLDEHDPEAQADLRTLRESGITASFFASYVPPAYANRQPANLARKCVKRRWLWSRMRQKRLAYSGS